MCTSKPTPSSAVDQAARELGHKTFPATTAGHQAAIRWARERYGADLRWAVEDCRHLSARLERDLLAAGQVVVRVPPKMMAEQRRIARTRGKSDPIDAAAVARAALREPDLPVAISRRDLAGVAAVGRPERRPSQDPNGDDQPAVVASPRARPWAQGTEARATLRAHLDTVSETGVAGLLAELARDELAEVAALTIHNRRPAPSGSNYAARTAAPTLLAMPGVGPLTTAKIVGETAGVGRFTSEAAFARYSRDRTDPGLVGPHRRPGPAGAFRQPATQRRRASDRDHPDPPRRPRAGLLPQEASRRHDQTRSPPLPQTTTRPYRLRPSRHRPTTRRPN